MRNGSSGFCLTHCADATDSQRLFSPAPHTAALDFIVVAVTPLGTKVGVVAFEHISVDFLVLRDEEVVLPLEVADNLFGQRARERKVVAATVEVRSLDVAGRDIEKMPLAPPTIRILFISAMESLTFEYLRIETDD